MSRLMLAMILAFGPSFSALAQTAPPDKPKAEEFAALLRKLSSIPVEKAREVAYASKETQPAVVYLIYTLKNFAAEGPSAEGLLAPQDKDGNLRKELELLAASSEKVVAGEKLPSGPARGLKDAGKKIGEADASDFDGSKPPSQEGFRHRTEIFGGSASFGGKTLPAVGLNHDTQYKRGPWGAELELGGVFSPGQSAPHQYSVEITGTHQLGDGPWRALVAGEIDHDAYLGAEGRAFRAGLGVTAIDNDRHELNFAFAAGPNRESKFNGEVEHFLSPAVAAEYTYKLTPGLRLTQELEGEFNAKTTSDIEFKSVSSVIWDLSRQLSIKLTNAYKMRTEIVDRYPGHRNITTLGFVWNF